jgi:hypothetical protein
MVICVFKVRVQGGVLVYALPEFNSQSVQAHWRNDMKLNHWFWAGIMAGALLAAGCSDDDGEKNDNAGGENTVVDTQNWIGNACSCESSTADECEMMGVPLPSPKGEGKITGCDNVDASAIAGGANVCLRTITGAAALVAPETYFPQGYCAISAVGCEGSKTVCEMVNYGDVKTMVSCPAGSTLLESKFSFKILASSVIITNKTCARNCNTNADCNEAGEMTCMQLDKAKFCYNQKNLDMKNIDGTPVVTKATPF